MLKSFIVTGASASGKTTLIREAKNNYIYLPTHMTRKPRAEEQDGIDAVFINSEKFIENFNNNMYLEPSLDMALLSNLGIYYGTPASWLKFLRVEGYCASPVSTSIANIIVSSCSVYWIHLYCSDEDRYKRLLSRGIDEKEINSRMTSGDSVYFPDSADLIINTSKYLPKDILKRINSL